MSTEILHGDCIEQMTLLIERGVMVDSIVTDPPAGIAFMGKEWDHHKGGRDQWIAWMEGVAAKALMLAKPGTHALVWALPKTSHWTVTAWENAGWEVRDRVSHLFGTGFPKSFDVSKGIDKALGFGRGQTGTKRVENRVAYSNTGALRCVICGNSRNGTSCQCPVDDGPATIEAQQWEGWGTALKPAMEDWWLLRKPLSEPTVAANVLKHGVGGLNIDGCRIGTEARTYSAGGTPGANVQRLHGGDGRDAENARSYAERMKNRPHVTVQGRFPSHLIHDGSEEVMEAFAGCGADTAARFFYSAKANKSDRFDSKHPTVKSISLLRYLCKLITPPGGVILDMFAGSGTTLAAAHTEGFDSIGIEKEGEYIEDIKRRVAFYEKDPVSPVSELLL